MFLFTCDSRNSEQQHPVSKLDIPAGKKINHIINLAKINISELKLFKKKEIIDKSTYKASRF